MALSDYMTKSKPKKKRFSDRIGTEIKDLSSVNGGIKIDPISKIIPKNTMPSLPSNERVCNFLDASKQIKD